MSEAELPSASVLINAYNYRAYVAEAVRSALAQEPAPREVIVVDDGSTDGTAEMLARDFADRPTVRVIAQANAGQLAAIQAGVREAVGEVLFFLDADDTWAPGYLRAALEVFATRPVDHLFAGHVRSDGAEPKTLGETASRQLGCRAGQAWLLRRFPMSMTSTLSMRRALARRFLPLPEVLWADWRTDADLALALGAALAGGCGYFLAGAHVNYRLHGANNFAGKKPVWPRLAKARAEHRLERAREALGRTLFAGPGVCDLAAEEFRTIERPSWREARRYLAVAAAGRGGWRRRFIARVMIIRAFSCRGV